MNEQQNDARSELLRKYTEFEAWLAHPANAILEEIAKREGVSKNEVINRLILGAENEPTKVAKTFPGIKQG